MLKKEIIVIAIVLVSTLLFFWFIHGLNSNSFLSVTYYDENFNQINTASSFSIIQVPLTAVYMRINIGVYNDGTTGLSCNPVISSFSPIEFKNAALISSTPITVASGQRIGWTSNYMNISTFLGRTNPQYFNATVNCSSSSYQNTSYSVQTGFIALNIGPVCGNKICETGETIKTCPTDCYNQKVIFKTTDSRYLSSTAIAYSSTCGNVLSRYGYYNLRGWANGNCDTYMPSSSDCGSANPIKIMGGLPLNISYFTVPTAYNASLWVSSDYSEACICIDGILGGNLQNALPRYKLNLYNYNIINNSSYPNNSNLEKYCFQ